MTIDIFMCICSTFVTKHGRKVIVLGVQQAAKSSYNVGVRCQLGRKSCFIPQSHLCPLFIVDVFVMIV